MAAVGFGPEAFDAGSPQAFYLGERHAELESLADAFLVVEGTRLPVHTSVLAVASPVLSGAFAGVGSPSEQACPSCGQKRMRDEARLEMVGQPCQQRVQKVWVAGFSKRPLSALLQGGELVLEAPFVGFSLYETALFLKLLYSQAWLADAPATLGALHGTLPALLRLAHRLNTTNLLAELCSYMPDASHTTMPLLVEWMQAAEACQLSDLQLGILQLLARRLVYLPDGNLGDTIAGAGALEQCNPATLVQLVAVMTAAGTQDRHSSPPLADLIPSKAAVIQAAADAAHTCSFEWTLPQFEHHTAEPCQRVTSPWFAAAGHSWRFVINRGSAEEGNAGYLAVTLECSTSGVEACCKLAVLDRAGAAYSAGQSTAVFQAHVAAGFPRFMTFSNLSARYLPPGDCLHLRATVTVPPS